MISSVSPLSVRRQQVRSFAGSGWGVSIWHIIDLFSCTRKTIKSDSAALFFSWHFIDPTLTDISNCHKHQPTYGALSRRRFCFCILEGVLKKAQGRSGQKKKFCMFGNKEAKSAGVTLCINVNIDREPVDVKEHFDICILKDYKDCSPLEYDVHSSR